MKKSLFVFFNRWQNNPIDGTVSTDTHSEVRNSDTSSLRDGGHMCAVGDLSGGNSLVAR